MAADRRSDRALIRPVTAEDVRPIRHRVLRPEQPFESTVYPGDNLPGTVHLGAFDGDALVGIASLYREPRGGATDGWRLRGMATVPAVRGRGIGAALLDACMEHAATSDGGEVWCNARVVAIGFYLRAGFEVVSEEFEVSGIGPHVVMTRPGSVHGGAG